MHSSSKPVTDGDRNPGSTPPGSAAGRGASVSRPSPSAAPALWPWLAAFAVLSAAVVLLFTPLTGNHPYEYDAADYMYAGVQGFWANYTDRASLPFWDFVRKGLELRNDPEKRTETSLHSRRTGDINIYRHFHGPLYAYWVAAWNNAGVRSEAAFRNLGFIPHVATALLMMFAFWTLFPSLPRWAGVLTAAAFLFNRTTLLTAIALTQHIPFVFSAALTLWMFALFVRNFEERYWYATMAALALAIAAVETSALLAATLFIVLAILYRPFRARWPGWRAQAGLLLKGVGVLAAVLFAIWPAGIYKLSVARGFMFLAYMALERKTFALYGPLEVWRQKFAAYPWEYGFLFAGFVAAIVLWNRLDHRREALPWIVYGLVFTAATMKVTLEYTHYRGTVMIAWAMCAGIAVGHLWKYSGAAVRTMAAVASVVCIVMTAADYRAEAAASRDPETATARVLNYIRQHPVPEGKVLYVPFYFVPALNFYHPGLKTVGYDSDWTPARLLRALKAGDVHGAMLCLDLMCRTVEAATGSAPNRALVAPAHAGQPLYAIPVPR